MPIRRVVKISLAIIACISLLILALETIPFGYYQLNKQAIDTAAALEADLGINTFSAASLLQLDLITLPSRWVALRDTIIATSKISAYTQQKQSIVAEFRSQVTAYIAAVKSYTGPDLTFLDEINLEAVPFAQQREPQAFITELKAKFRAAIVRYNSTASTPLRWEINPVAEAAQMTVAQKVGLLFAFPLTGKSLSAADAEFLRRNNIGAVTYFAENVANPAQLSAFSQSIQKLNTQYPVLITADQEGSPVQRLFWDTNGGSKQIAKESNESQCARWTARAKLLSEAGVNWNLGIVADVTTNSASFIFPRTFSSDYARAADSVKIASECSPHVLSTLKHWPGHGSTTVDTHRQLGRLSVATEADWKSKDYLPFAAGIAGNADSIMVGHLLTPWLDPNTPTSLSKQHVDYLRDTLHFKGLIVTDDLNMLKASGFDLEAVARQALLAGNDVLFIVNNDLALRQRIIDQTIQMVTNGEITEEDLDQRVQRILQKINQTLSSPIPAELVY